jgi:DNA-binding transcriptional regulator PaaX
LAITVSSGAVNWLLIVYRIPREPTAARVSVWRKLTRLGALPLQDAVWILPADNRNREQVQWIASEIIEIGGEASLFDANVLMTNSDPSLAARFEAPVQQAYQEILAALKRRKPDLAALSKKYQQTKQRDFFHCSLGEKVRAKLLATEGGK